MSGETPVSIPEPLSSNTSITSRSKSLQQSRQDLKRKLSTVSFEASPIEYTKLRIEDLSAEREEEMIHKECIDEEKQNLSNNELRKAHREANQRIISLGDTLWTQAQQLRQLEEDTGAIP